MAITKEAAKVVEEEEKAVVLPSVDEPVPQWHVHHMIRSIALTNPPQGGAYPVNVIDGEIAQYLNNGYTMDKVVYLGTVKAPDNIYPIGEKVLYVLVKYG